MRTALIVGNQKLYLNLDASIKFAGQLKSAVGGRQFPFELAVCPSFISLAHAAEVLKGSHIAVGAQDVHQQDNGAFTGQVTMSELEPLEVRYIILGHSELRSQQGETNEMVNGKIKLCLQKGVVPIACVGETREQRDSGRSREVIERDVRDMFKDIAVDEVDKVVIAYEPVWAIAGQGGVAATPEVANEMHQFIRGVVSGIYSSDVARQMSVIYGGSVSPDNATSFLSQPSIDGLLIGSASVRIESFLTILDRADELLSDRPATRT